MCSILFPNFYLFVSIISLSIIWKTFPTIFDLHHLFFSEPDCIEFLFNQEILYRRPTCANCRRLMVRRNTLWRCEKRSCRKSVSIFQDTIISASHLPCNKILFVGYLWLCQTQSTTIQIMTGHSSSTIASLLRQFRLLVASDLEDPASDSDSMIGGEEIVVEIDESKFYNPRTNDPRTNAKVGWVFGGVERTAERRIFIERVEDRSADTLLEIIRRRVRPGSIILTDCWRAYNNIQTQLGLQHFRVNHSRTFVDPRTGAHTNTIEGTWRGLKLAIPQIQRAEDKIDSYLLEFVWRRKNEGCKWEEFLRCLKNIAIF